MTAADFKRLSRKRWDLRANALKGRVENYRCLDFNNVSARLRAMLPGASNHRIRELAFKRICVATIALAAAFDRENTFMKEARALVQEDYAKDIQAAADDPPMTPHRPAW
jgi:hypothetical protein